MSIPAEKAAAIWRFCKDKLMDDGMTQMRKSASTAMAQDTSTDHIESKALIAKVLYGFYQDESALQEGCTGIDNLQAFSQAMAHNFLLEPALTARAELYEALGLPPPDTTGGSLTSRLGMKS